VARIGGLYVLIDPGACGGRSPVEVAEATLRGGASMLQWRDKARDKGEQLPDVRAIYQLCRGHDAVLVVNDHADLALVLHDSPGPAGLLGVHVGQKDLPAAAVRRIVPAGFVVGVSTNNPDEAIQAERDGASYIAVGDIFGTTAKQGTRPASPERLAEVKAAVRLPVIGIGGINAGNVARVMAAGADGVAVISAVCLAPDPELAARELLKAMKQ
jgi:thiamine-phosphate pyrophosphorylase